MDWTDAVSIRHFIDHPEEASPAAVREMAERLLEHGVDVSTGHRPPGLYVHGAGIPAVGYRQVTRLDVQSTAVHSRRRGWIPHVALTWRHVPLQGPGAEEEFRVMAGAESIGAFVENMLDAAEAAIADVAAGPREG